MFVSILDRLILLWIESVVVGLLLLLNRLRFVRAVAMSYELPFLCGDLDLTFKIERKNFVYVGNMIMLGCYALLVLLLLLLIEKVGIVGILGCCDVLDQESNPDFSAYSGK